ncbi:MAG: exosortase/archaeosortase family protein, partial [Candidatus Rokuibacteriota bacterium]
PLVALGLGLYAVASLGSEPFLARLSFPVTLAGGVLLLSGTAIARQALPGVAYLAFMMPLPYVALKGLTATATLFDARVTAAMLPWLGVPVHRRGTLLYLANMTLEVADACSSIPAIASLLALGAAYGFVRRRSVGVTLLLLVAAIPLGVTANIVRIVLTAAGVHYLGPIAIHNAIHTWHGTSVFLVTFAALALVDAGIERLRRGRR